MDIVIAVDPATTSGLAWCGRDREISSKSVLLAKESQLRKLDLRFFDPRPVSLRREVLRVIWGCSEFLNWESGNLPLKVMIAFEDVQFAKSIAQVQLWGTLRGALWTVGEELPPERASLSYLSCPTGKLKQHATGNGGADKVWMARAAARYWPGYVFADDNEVDARLLLRWALDKIKN